MFNLFLHIKEMYVPYKKKFMFHIYIHSAAPYYFIIHEQKSYNPYNVLNTKLEKKDSILKRKECARQHK